MNLYYDINGKVISLEEWSILFEKTEDRIIEFTELYGGRVSTVWLGITHFGPGKLNIFETMVFGIKPFSEEQERYDTKEDAIIGHNRMVKKIKQLGQMNGITNTSINPCKHDR